MFLQKSSCQGRLVGVCMGMGGWVWEDVFLFWEGGNTNLLRKIPIMNSFHRSHITSRTAWCNEVVELPDFALVVGPVHLIEILGVTLAVDLLLSLETNVLDQHLSDILHYYASSSPDTVACAREVLQLASLEAVDAAVASYNLEHANIPLCFP